MTQYRALLYLHPDLDVTQPGMAQALRVLVFDTMRSRLKQRSARATNDGSGTSFRSTYLVLTSTDLRYRSLMELSSGYPYQDTRTFQIGWNDLASPLRNIRQATTLAERREAVGFVYPETFLGLIAVFPGPEITFPTPDDAEEFQTLLSYTDLFQDFTPLLYPVPGFATLPPEQRFAPTTPSTTREYLQQVRYAFRRTSQSQDRSDDPPKTMLVAEDLDGLTILPHDYTNLLLAQDVFQGRLVLSDLTQTQVNSINDTLTYLLDVFLPIRSRTPDQTVPEMEPEHAVVDLKDLTVQRTPRLALSLMDTGL